MKRYNPKEIEPRWQQAWDKDQVYVADLASNKPKYIAMSMFNYPSGAGIHIGHAMNYTISDVMARFKRQQGFESYHPVGWDAFGLPAENYAIKSGVSPQASMAKIIPSYHTQYKAMGWSNDWSKEISTHLPEYYRWTQWIFWKMYDRGMAYQDARMQWWCDKCQTVLANEQVLDNKCWRHDSVDDPNVERREVKQWFFKITDYADEILQATDALDWSDTVKLAQKNWIGKKTGINITYRINNVGSEEDITVFTTRPDTNYGATFVVLAPEHPFVQRVISQEVVPVKGPSHWQAVDHYVQKALRKTELERQQEGRLKTGAFTGFYVTNPLNGKELPVWVSDFVLAGFGTGAVVGVPGHDMRDFQFAKQFNIPIERVVVGPDGDTSPIEKPEQVQEESGKMINSGELDGLDIHAATQKMMDIMAERGMGERVTTFAIRDWSVSRQRYWGAPIPIVHCPKDGIVLVPEDQLPVLLPELEDFQPSGDGRSALARATDWLQTTCPTCGGPAERETDTLDTYICSSWYELRYFDPHNSAAPFSPAVANKWMPVDFYNGGDHATAHLIYVRFIARFFHKLGLLDDPEPFKKFLFNGKVTASDGTMFSKSKGNGVDPLEIIASGYGADALRTYLMFAAPLDIWMRWDPQGVPGTYRFLNRVWNITQEFIESPTDTSGRQTANNGVLRVIHPAIKQVTSDLESQKYNTAIAAMMKATNQLYEIKAKEGFVGSASWQFALQSLVALVAPFAPHIADELWHDLGNVTSVQRDSWPTYVEAYLQSETVTMAVQINGKVRGEITLPKDADESAAIEAAHANPRIQEHIAGRRVTKTIYVPARILNMVVAS